MAYHQRQRCRGESSSQYSENDESQSIHSVLENVCHNLSLDASEVARANQDLQTVIQDHLIQSLKEDPIFSYLYQEIVYCGSFYNGLKVQVPNEFDLTVVLKLPVSLSFLQLSTMDAPPGHLRILNFRNGLQSESALQEHKNYVVKQLLMNWCSNDGALLQSKCRQWFYGLVHKYIDCNSNFLEHKLEQVAGKFRRITLKSQGPATTLKIGNDLSIDLVPAFEFKPFVTPPLPFRKLKDMFKKPKRPHHPGFEFVPRYNYQYSIRKMVQKEYSWYAVPKPIPVGNDIWRASFVRHERELLKDVGYVKPAVRMIKKLRDSRKWINLHSYFINTVALWEIHHHNLEYRDSNLVNCFFGLLKSLLQRIENNNLVSFWDSNLNLLDNMRCDARINLANELKRLVLKFDEYKEYNPLAIGAIVEHGTY